MDQITIAVTGINAIDNPAPGVGVAKSLKEDTGLNARVVGLSYDAMEPGNFLTDKFDKAYLMPYPSGDPTSYLDRLLYIKNSYGLDFIIPTLDLEIPLFIKIQPELEAAGIGVVLPTLEQFKLRGKDQLEPLAKALGIELPETKVITSEKELQDSIEELELPLMVKGVYYKAKYCATAQAAHQAYHGLVAEWGFPIIVQKVVAGDEVNLIGVGDGEGGSLGMVAIKKTGVTELGKIWTGVTINHPKILAAAEAFLKKYQWQGPFELECLQDKDDFYLIEINPRFPAWSYFATGVGINLPSNMVRHALKKEHDSNKSYEAGKLFVRYVEEIILDLDILQQITTQGER